MKPKPQVIALDTNADRIFIQDHGTKLRVVMGEETSDEMLIDIDKKQLKTLKTSTTLGRKVSSIKIATGLFRKQDLYTLEELSPSVANELQETLTYAKETYSGKGFLNGGVKWFFFGTVFGLVLFYVAALIAFSNQIEAASQKPAVQAPTAELWEP